jgi:kinesin family protein 5
VDQNSTLKKEAGIAERKLLARNERIQNLESLLQDADRRLSAQNQKFEAQLQAVKDRLDQARGMALSSLVNFVGPLTITGRFSLVAQKAASASPLTFGRIAKPLRGGGGVAPPASIVPSSISPGVPSQLNRIQNEEGG